MKDSNNYCTNAALLDLPVSLWDGFQIIQILSLKIAQNLEQLAVGKLKNKKGSIGGYSIRVVMKNGVFV